MLQSALGRDLGDVRIRVDRDAQRFLNDLGADAAAQGATVAISPEHDRPQTKGGRALLLHELIHVLQQRERPTGPAPDGAESERLEQQARRLSVALVSGWPTPAARAGRS